MGEIFTISLAVMRVFAALALIAATALACGGGGIFRPYEYEEEMYLSLDGTVTVYVNASIAALDALHGASFDPHPNVAVDRNAVRAYFTSPQTRASRVTSYRRSNRRFVQVRVDCDDVTHLAEAAPFAWSRYRLTREDNSFGRT